MRAMRRILAHLTIALFALRALLPAGFMPDLNALGTGHLDLVLCTAQPGALAVPDSRAPVAPQKSSPGAHCPFGMALVKSFVAPIIPALPQRLARADLVVRAQTVAELLPPSHGPPLGSRAPPVLTV
jgi:hypothetical protein